jgi:type I restriction enzyme R subunit
VDMIATGTDVRPLEVVLFLRDVKSRNLFEQMKGRGARVVKPDELRGVAPDAAAETHFIIVDAVGVCESELVDTHPLEKKRVGERRTAILWRRPKPISSGNRELLL